jgi:hypothetical protein
VFSFEREQNKRRFLIDGDGGALVAFRVPLGAEAVARRRA